jgi:Arc/MetJ-type ribon-helix-helix transcriptional regulator
MARVAKAPAVSAARRRRRSEVPTVKKSFTLHEDVVQAVDAAVKAGEIENQSAFVEAAIEEKLRRSKRAKLYRAYGAAAQDPAFMADMQAVSAQFDDVTGDGLRDI